VNRVGRVNEVLAQTPSAKALGAKWNPQNPIWDKAFDEMLTAVMNRFDELHDAPEAYISGSTCRSSRTSRKPRQARSSR
jgi:hypothetical protein